MDYNVIDSEGNKIETNNYARLYVGVRLSGKMIKKEGQLIMIWLCRLALPKCIPGLGPFGLILPYYFLVRHFF